MTDKPKHAGGGPTKYTKALGNKICASLEIGKSLRKICTSDKMPTARTVHNWLRSRDEFFRQYTRAREIQADTIFDECLDIADENLNDTIMIDGREQTNHDVIARAKLKIDTRKWMAGKLRPKSYGDKVLNEHSGPDGGPITTVTRGMTAKEAADAYADTLSKA
jgi:hypothetical protein